MIGGFVFGRSRLCYDVRVKRSEFSLSLPEDECLTPGPAEHEGDPGERRNIDIEEKSLKIAYSGIEGAFAHIAARRLYPQEELVACRTFREAYEKVEEGSCDAAVLPIENSYAGEVGQVTDLMFSGDLVIEDVYDMHVTQNLVGIPGAVLSDIRRVISHPQALGQCENFVRTHELEQEAAVNTARAAQAVAQAKDIHTAAIASAETAEIYGLEIILPDINESRDNTTRFAVFVRKDDGAEQTQEGETEKDGFILLFTVPNIAGGLARALNIIGEYGFNMSILRSRPMKTLAWNYYFYVEAEGDITGICGTEMLARLSFWCEMLKVVGRYTRKKELQGGGEAGRKGGDGR